MGLHLHLRMGLHLPPLHPQIQSPHHLCVQGHHLLILLRPLCGPVQVKVGVKDNQTTNTQVTVIMRDVGLRNYGEFNEPFFCNEAVLWAVDENGWALLACRSV